MGNMDKEGKDTGVTVDAIINYRIERICRKGDRYIAVYTWEERVTVLHRLPVYTTGERSMTGKRGLTNEKKIDTVKKVQKKSEEFEVTQNWAEQMYKSALERGVCQEAQWLNTEGGKEEWVAYFIDNPKRRINNG